MSVPVNEQETVIQISRDSDYAKIWTSDTTTMTKLDKMADDPDNNDWSVVDVGKVCGEIVNKEYKCTKGLISFRSKTKNSYLTDEQKERLAENLKAARMKKRS